VKRALCSAAPLFLCFSGCAVRYQSAVDAAGPQATRIAGLFWMLTGLLGAIFVAVMALALWAVTRKHRGIEQEPLETTHIPSSATETTLTRRVAAATAATVLIIFGLLVASILTGKSVSDLSLHKNGIAIEVTGNQWWWYVRYLNDDPSRMVITANEIVIPVGRPVMIRGTSHDVIHSFWVPNLHGKRDLIPSRVTTEWIQADRRGLFRGQCAEFCGAQHAHMALWVKAVPEAEFEAWMEHQRQPAVAPADADRQRGQQVFLNHACVFCHAIAGTAAAGQVGPDLTHFGSRITIAAGTLPNTKGHLGGWIADPQNIKPGNHMATVSLAPEDVQPLLDYLESLK
jgi:cytochrome c oxidase subunit II